MCRIAYKFTVNATVEQEDHEVYAPSLILDTSVIVKMSRKPVYLDLSSDNLAR